MRLIAVAVLTATLAGPVAANDQQIFGAWTADCDPLVYCSADVTGTNDDYNYRVRIGRHDQEVYWEVSLTTAAPVDLDAEAIILSVDADSQPFEGAAQVGRYGSGTDYYFLGDAIQSVLDKMPHGKTLAIGIGDAIPVEFSLDGLAAALMWIDEQQSRIGSERVAEAAPIGLDPIDPNAAILGQIPPALMAMRDSDVDCRPLAEITNGEEIELDQLDATTRLFILPCWDAAYNFGWKAYVEWSGESYSAVALPELSETRGWSAGTNLVNYAYDPATKELSTYYKARGMGDCGNGGTYRWADYSFILVEFRSHEDCDAPMPDDVTEDFPVVYPAPDHSALGAN